MPTLPALSGFYMDFAKCQRGKVMKLLNSDVPNFVDFANNEMSRETNENKLHVSLLSWNKFGFIEIGSILLTVQFMKRLAREPIQSTFNGSNTFGTMEISSRQG